MIWEDLSLLWLLLLLPLLIFGSWWYSKRLDQKRKAYFGAELFEKLRMGFWPLGQRLRMISIYLGLAFLIVAAAGPKIGTEVREVKRQGVDLLIALDLSASMNAEDVNPSRLSKAKYEIRRLIDRLEGDRIGLVVFTGEAYLQSPITMDYSALRMFLDIAETGQMPSSTTEFNEAMNTAHQAFQSLEEESESGTAAKVLLIISDGEDHGESYSDELEQLLEQNVAIYTLGIGSESGGRIPIYEDSYDLIGYKRDNNGQVVTTRLQRETLQEIATEGNGEYYEIRSGSGSLDSFLGRIDELQQGQFEAQEFTDYKNRYQMLALIGLVFLVAGMIVPESKLTNVKP